MRHLISGLQHLVKSHKVLLQQVTRGHKYHASPFLVDVEITAKYEKSRNPEEWKYVERVLPNILIPEPKKLEHYQSGWKPPSENLQNRPYYVGRTRNHMIPVYLYITRRGTKRETIIKKIEGDIWQLEKELRPFIEDLIKPRLVRLQVNELAGKIVINGDHVNAIKYWLSEKNF